MNQSILKKIPPSKEIEYTVVKRNGTLAPFRKERIFNAIEAAFYEVNNLKKGQHIDLDLKKEIEKIAELVIKEVLHFASKGTLLTVEGIQDVVEVTLMKKGYHDVAKAYILYRDLQKKKREEASALKIYRHDRQTPVRFNPIKIASTIESAFRRSKMPVEMTPEEFVERINGLSQKVVADATRMAESDQTLYFDTIQDMIEKELMEEKFFEVAKDYIIYRSEKKKIQLHPEQTDQKAHKEFTVIAEDGSKKTLTEGTIKQKITFACRDLAEVNVEELFEATLLNFYEGMTEKELDISYVLAAKTFIEKEPSYSTVAARLLLDTSYHQAIGISFQDPSLKKEYRRNFSTYLKKAISLELISPALLNFDLDLLSSHLNIERDDQFTYLGIQTLFDRYFIHHKQIRLETPQWFFMRVAMGLSIKEEDKNQRAIEFYEILSSFAFMSSTPTLFNAGTLHSQLSSCYLSTIEDDLHHIFKVVADDAQLSKWAGGIGNDWTNVRATGSRIKGTNGESQGVIPFLKVANDTAVAVNQGGKRKGAMCAYLETWHLDIEDFLELRKNTGDERRRTHDMNTANWIPDLFMKRVKEKGSWTLFSPSDAPDLHDLYGKAFEKRYQEYEKMVAEGKITLYKKVEALDLWRKMLSMIFETGHPWITFKDPSNIRSPQDHVGVVHSSNLCTEILLNTSKEETAVCNLGSVNLPFHTTEKGIDEKKLKKTIQTAIRMLDNVVDINFYPTEEAKISNHKHRPVGLGIMGFQDALFIQNISFASFEAVEFADKSMEMVSYYAISSSSDLAKERGAYSTFKGSKWDRGLLPIDTIDLLEEQRGEKIEMDRSFSMDWNALREKIKKQGMRNSNTMAIAPTATISNITGVTQSIEPMYKHLFVKSNLSGEFTITNPYLIEKLKKLDLWDDEMIDDLKYFDGSLTEIERIPEEVKKIFLTAFEIEPEWLIECASRRQKWIDMGQSLNLYMSEPSGKKLHNMYLLAWEKALKTMYYLRSTSATQIEKSSIDINKRGLQPRWMKNQSASSEISVDREKKPIVCNLEEGCESCQ